MNFNDLAIEQSSNKCNKVRRHSNDARVTQHNSTINNVTGPLGHHVDAGGGGPCSLFVLSHRCLVEISNPADGALQVRYR
jgi:hypothetical protein